MDEQAYTLIADLASLVESIQPESIVSSPSCGGAPVQRRYVILTCR